MRVMAVINQKGGVGKSTITANLAHALARGGYRVLALDLDPQGHLGRFFGQQRGLPGLEQLFRGQATLNDLVDTIRPGLDLVVPGDQLNQMDGLAPSCAGQAWTLGKGVAQTSGYDFVLVDCPPSTGLLGMNGLLCAQELLMPVAADFLALDGLARLVSIVRALEARTGQARQMRIVVSRYQSQRRVAREMREHLVRQFPEALLDPVISESVALAESPAYGQTIFEYQPQSRSARECQELADCILAARAA